MKKAFIIVMILLAASQVFATPKELFYQHFGARLLQAVIMVIKDEINILRVRAGLEPRTNEQMVDAITARYLEITE